MQIAPLFKTIADYMPAALSISNCATSLTQLAFDLPLEVGHIHEHRVAQTPLRLGMATTAESYSREENKNFWLRISHAANLSGCLAFGYFTNPYGLIIGYLFWAGYYAAQLYAYPLNETSDFKDKSWTALHYFGAITSIACAIFASGAWPISLAVASTRVAVTILSYVETSIFFYKLAKKLCESAEPAARAVVTAVTPYVNRRNGLPTRLSLVNTST